MPLEACRLGQKIASSIAGHVIVQHESGHDRGAAAAQPALHRNIALDLEVQSRQLDTFPRREGLDAAHDVVVASVGWRDTVMRPGVVTSTRRTVTRRYSCTATASASKPGPRFEIEPGTSRQSPSTRALTSSASAARFVGGPVTGGHHPPSAADRRAGTRGNQARRSPPSRRASVAGAHGSMVTTKGSASFVPAGS